jgi:hypothetical protein
MKGCILRNVYCNIYKIIKCKRKISPINMFIAMIGTMRDFPKVCSICGDVGHQEWQCSKEALITFQSKVCDII